MFKVSFKDNFKKVQTFNNKVTIVTLIGLMDYPAKLWDVVPTEVTDWMWHHPTVDVSWAKGGESFRLEFSGKAICSDSDDFNPVLGERIAESRAKIRLYKFMATLIDKLCAYYFSLIYGGGEVTEIFLDSKKHGIYQDYKRYTTLLKNEEQHLTKLLEQV